MKKTATRWAAIAGGALGAVLLVAPGASADPLPLEVNDGPVQVLPGDSTSHEVTLPGAPSDAPDPGHVDVLNPDDGGITVFGRWDDELI